MDGRRSPLPEQVHDHAEGAFIHDIRKRVLPLDPGGAHVKLLVPHQIGKDQDQGLPVHMVGYQDPDRIQDLTADDVRYLRERCIPQIRMQKLYVGDNEELSFEVEMRPEDVVLLHIYRE